LTLEAWSLPLGPSGYQRIFCNGPGNLAAAGYAAARNNG